MKLELDDPFQIFEASEVISTIEKCVDDKVIRIIRDALNANVVKSSHSMALGRQIRDGIIHEAV